MLQAKGLCEDDNSGYKDKTSQKILELKCNGYIALHQLAAEMA